MALTIKEIRSLSRKGRYCDGKNLYLQVDDAGSRSWLFRFMRQGVAREMGLGSADQIDLPAAREKALQARQQLARGIDPIAARQAEKAAQALTASKVKTFKQAVEQYGKAHEAGWRGPTAKQFYSVIRLHAFPTLENVLLDQIDQAAIMRIIEPLWTSKNSTASLLRSHVEGVLDWAIVKGYRPAGLNPARWEGCLEHQLAKKSQVAKVRHFAAMPYDQLPGFIQTLRGHSGIPARALEFTILTCARINEVCGASWSEVDFQKKLWTIPAERMKAGQEHVVPLCSRAIEILQTLPRNGDTLFAKGHKTVGRVLKSLDDTVTIHGFRSSFRDWAAEKTETPHEVCEQALAHLIKSKTTRAYLRGNMIEKRRKLMDQWANYCDGQDNVVPIRQVI